MPDRPRLAVESIAGQRPYQEDSVLAETLPDGRTLVAVADGMGGHAAGEVASALALETLVNALGAGADLDDAFRMANQRVHEKAREPGKQGMGTTMVALLVEDGEYLVANVGDSRGYLLADGQLKRLTEDHSFVAEAIKSGQSEEEAMSTPWKDALTRSIGTEPRVEVDVFGPFPLVGDAAFLMCSDGLYKTLADRELQSLFGEADEPASAAKRLVSAAFDNGSDDNISVAIAEFRAVPEADQEGSVLASYDVEPEAESLATLVGVEAVPATTPSASAVPPVGFPTTGAGHAGGGTREGGAAFGQFLTSVLGAVAFVLLGLALAL